MEKGGRRWRVGRTRLGRETTECDGARRGEGSVGPRGREEEDASWSGHVGLDNFRVGCGWRERRRRRRTRGFCSRKTPRVRRHTRDRRVAIRGKRLSSQVYTYTPQSMRSSSSPPEPGRLPIRPCPFPGPSTRLFGGRVEGHGDLEGKSWACWKELNKDIRNAPPARRRSPFPSRPASSRPSISKFARITARNPPVNASERVEELG